MLKTFGISLLCLLSVLAVQGQDSSNTDSDKKVVKFLEIGTSANSYKGDLSAGYEKWAAGFQMGFQYNRSKRFNGRFRLMIGMVTGQNINYDFDNGELPPPTPNKFFQTLLLTLNYDLHYNFIKTEHFMAYVSQGIGLMRFEPWDQNYEPLADQLNTRAPEETYSNIALIFPTALGGMYKLSNDYGIGLEVGLLHPTTDYMDNISQWSDANRSDNMLFVKISTYIPVLYE